MSTQLTASYFDVLEFVTAKLAAVLAISEDQIGPSQNLEDEFDADSTELTELAAEIEKHFGVSIAKIERQQWTTCENISQSVVKNLG